MNELLKRDITIRTISVLFAVFLWFFVSYSTNPIVSSNVDIPLRVINEDSLTNKGIVIRNRDAFPRNIGVTVRGKKDVVSNLSTSGFDAVVDLSKVKDISTTQVEVDISTSISDISIEGVKQKSVILQLEKNGKNSFPVELITNGKPKDGYKILKVTVTPQSVSLTGFDSVIKMVGSVKTLIDINNLDKDFVIKKECKVYNKDGKEMAEVGKDLSVEIKVEVAREVPVVGSLKGKPARNFAESTLSIVPDKVLVAAPADVLGSLTQLVIDPVDIENAEKPVQVKRAIKLPDGARLVDSPNEATVNVDIEQFTTKDIVLKKDDISLMNTEIDNTLKYDIQTDTLTISVKGIQPDLQQLDLNKLKPGIDVEKLTEGTYKIPLKVVLPSTVKLVQDYTVDVKIDKR